MIGFVSSRGRLAAGTLLSLTLSSPVFAQQPAAAAAPAPPPSFKWTTNVGLNVAWQTGSTDQRNIQLTGSVDGVEGTRRSLVLDGSHLQSKVKVEGTDVTVADQQQVRLTGRQQLSGHWYAVARAGYLRNEIQFIDYVFEELVGIGYGRGGFTGPVPKWRFDVIPVVGLAHQDKNIPALDGTTGTYGILQNYMVQRPGRWMLTEGFGYLQNTDDSDDYRMNFQVSLNTTLLGPVGSNVTYIVQHNNIVRAGSESTDQRLMLGFTLTLPRPRQGR